MLPNQIVLGDCREVMSRMAAASVDFALTDPPYLVGYRDRAGRSIQGDTEPSWLKPAFEQIYRLLKPDSVAVSFYGWSKVDLFVEAWKAAGFRLAGHLVFPKRYTSATRMLKYQHENGFLLAKGNPVPPRHIIGDCVEGWTYHGNAAHPTQKPTSVLTPLIESFCPRGGIVLDPFAGSGSTCIAARSLGRHFIGIELDPAYHAAAAARLNRLTRRLAALGEELRAAGVEQPIALAA